MRSEEPIWKTTKQQNLIRYQPSGTYFARFKAGGKLIRKSLHTTVFSVAKLRLPDLIREHRKISESSRRFSSGKMCVGDVVKVYRMQLQRRSDIKPRTRFYLGEVLEALLKSWPGIASQDVRKISERDCHNWASAFYDHYSPTRFNAALSILRNIFDIAIDAGARFANPAARLKRARVRTKKLNLPSREQFAKFVNVIATGGSRDSKNCADLVQFLAFSGLRIGEAKHVKWRDIDWSKKRMHVRGDPHTGTKNSESRFVPMIPDLHRLLEKLQSPRSGEKSDAPVMLVCECQKSMDRAARVEGMERLTHHDLRHLFASTCIEAGVDIPTVSRWLGHRDGGALAMKVYGHLRDEHSAEQAQRVRFNP
jgi:integrase